MDSLDDLSFINQDDSVRLIQKAHQYIPVIVKDSRSGQITIYNCRLNETIADLKNTISNGIDISTHSIKIAMHNKEISNNTLLSTFIEKMKSHPLEAIIRPLTVKTTYDHSSGRRY